MSPLQIVFGAILGVISLIIITVVLLQESRQAGISGAISGGADSFLGKNKTRTREVFFEKSTKIVAVLFFVLTIALDCIILFVK